MGRARPPSTLHKRATITVSSFRGRLCRVWAPFKAGGGRDWPSTGPTSILCPRMDRFLRKPR